MAPLGSAAPKPSLNASGMIAAEQNDQVLLPGNERPSDSAPLTDDPMNSLLSLFQDLYTLKKIYWHIIDLQYCVLVCMHNKVNHLYIYIYTHSFRFFPMYVITEHYRLIFN